MYAALGNKAEQERIRKANPTPKDAPTDRAYHCKKLIKSADSCNHVPLGDGKYGICKSNPYHLANEKKRAEALQTIAALKGADTTPDQEELIHAEAQRVYSEIAIGLIKDSTALTPTEFALACYKKQEHEVEMAKATCQLTGNILANRMAEILAKMFGGKPKSEPRRRRK